MGALGLALQLRLGETFPSQPSRGRAAFSGTAVLSLSICRCSLPISVHASPGWEAVCWWPEGLHALYRGILLFLCFFFFKQWEVTRRHFPPTVTLNASQAINTSQNSAWRMLATAAPAQTSPRRTRVTLETSDLTIRRLQLLAWWAQLLEKSEVCPWDGRNLLRTSELCSSGFCYIKQTPSKHITGNTLFCSSRRAKLRQKFRLLAPRGLASVPASPLLQGEVGRRCLERGGRGRHVAWKYLYTNTSNWCSFYLKRQKYHDS